MQYDGVLCLSTATVPTLLPHQHPDHMTSHTSSSSPLLHTLSPSHTNTNTHTHFLPTHKISAENTLLCTLVGKTNKYKHHMTTLCIQLNTKSHTHKVWDSKYTHTHTRMHKEFISLINFYSAHSAGCLCTVSCAALYQESVPLSSACII